MIFRPYQKLVFTLILSIFIISGLSAQETDQGYMMPPKAIADLIDAPYSPRVSVSPDNKTILLMHYPGLPSIEEVAQPELRLAGFRFNPRTSGPSRGWYYNNLSFMSMDGGGEIEIAGLPEKKHIANASWSPDGKWVAFANTADDKITLWLIDVAKASARQLSPVAINDIYASPFHWLSDSKTLAAMTIPDDRGEVPPEPTVPSGPTVQENMGEVAPARTYQDLLKNEYDAQLYEYYLTVQIAAITLDGKVSPLGEKGIYTNCSPSPDGRYFLTSKIHRPFSYTLPAARFPRLVEVWDRDGNFVYRVADLPLADNIPVAFGSVATGRRDYGWGANMIRVT